MVSELSDILQEMDDKLDLDQKGQKVYKYGADDKETDALMSKMTDPQYQLTFCLNSKVKKMKNIRVIKKGKMYSIIQY